MQNRAFFREIFKRGFPNTRTEDPDSFFRLRESFLDAGAGRAAGKVQAQAFALPEILGPTDKLSLFVDGKRKAPGKRSGNVEGIERSRKFLKARRTSLKGRFKALSKTFPETIEVACKAVGFRTHASKRRLRQGKFAFGCLMHQASAAF